MKLERKSGTNYVPVPSIKEINASKKLFTGASFFSGCGGSSTGHKLGGVNILYANEFVRAAQDTYVLNAPNTYMDRRDVRTVKPEDVLRICGLKKGEMDLLDGSPPCFVAGTLVFTKLGHVPIENIKDGDEVLTHANKWRRVTGATVRKYSGRMLRLFTMNTEAVECTPEHGFYVLRDGKKQWLAADDLTIDDYIKVPRSNGYADRLPNWAGIEVRDAYNRTTGEFEKTYRVSTLSKYFDQRAFWWIVGRFLGDGWVQDTRRPGTERRPTGSRRVKCVICCSKTEDELNEITSVLDMLGWQYTVSETRTVYRVVIRAEDVYGSVGELVAFFSQFGTYAHGKRLPQFVYELPSHLKEALVRGYFTADGRYDDARYGARIVSWSSVSRELAHGITRLINDCRSICANRILVKEPMAWNIEGRSGTTRKTYVCKATIGKVGKSLGYKEHEGDLWVRVREVQPFEFSGNVYNMHVDVDESYTANGLAAHNCSSFSTAGLADEAWGHEKLYSDGMVQRTDDLFEEFIRILRGVMPKTFVIENVTGMVVGKAKGMFLYVLDKLRKSGYQVEVRALRASRLGVPQARDRLIFVGVRNDLAKMGLAPVHPRPYPMPEPTVRDVFPYIVGIKTKKQNILQYVPSDTPHPTITASDAVSSETASFSSGAFIETEDGTRRKYTIPELKVICGFPQDFEFSGRYEKQFERMGRAVPPMMMAHVTQQIVRDILIPYYKKAKKTPGVPDSCTKAVKTAQKAQAVEWQKVLDAEAERDRLRAERKAAREAKEATKAANPTSKPKKTAQKPAKRATDGAKPAKKGRKQ